jgi:hypothetical protein
MEMAGAYKNSIVFTENTGNYRKSKKSMKTIKSDGNQ